MVTLQEITKAMPNIIAESNEPVNLAFKLPSKEWHQTLREVYGRDGWIEGLNRHWIEGKTVIIALDEISKVEKNDLAFAGNTDYLKTPVNTKLGMFEVWIPFSRDHFRVWRFKRHGNNYFLKASATYDYGFRVYDLHVENKFNQWDNLHKELKKTIQRSKSRRAAINKLKRIEIGHIVTACNRSRINSSGQYGSPMRMFRKAKDRHLKPTGVEIYWDGLLDFCYF